MGQIEYRKSYKEYKEELSAELAKTAESFVKIGYMLKVARDTDILKESGYDNVVEFAKAEYGIDKTQVSRFIRINDKFSEGGNSDHLLEEYQGFGYAKLTLMLQLPDAVNEGLTTNYSKAEIQAIKEELDEEKKVTDIERMIEKTECDSLSTIEKVIIQLGETEPELFCEVCIYKRNPNRNIQELKDIMAPSEEKTYSVRVPGIGRIILMLSPSEVRMVNSRTGIKEMSTWEELENSWPSETVAGRNPEEIWTELYCRPYPKKEEVAPVQQKKKDTKVKKAKPDEKQKPVKKEAPKPETKPVEDVHESENHAHNEENPEQQAVEEDVHQEPEGQQAEPEILEGTVEDSGAPEQESEEAAVNKESDKAAVSEEPDQAAGLLSEQEIQDIWSDIKKNAKEVYEVTQLFDINKVPAFGLAGFEEAYDTAINLAAGLEKMMMNERRRENGTSEERSSDTED